MYVNDSNGYGNHSKPSQSEDSVLYAFGTETIFGRIQKLGRMKMERSASIVTKILDIEGRNADKTFSKRGFSSLCLRHSNHVWPELESWKNDMWKGQYLLLPKF